MTRLFRLLARVPLPLAQRIGVLLGWIVWWSSPTYRRNFRAQSRAAGFAAAEVRPAIGAAGMAVAELPWLWARPQGLSVLPRIVRWEGAQAYEAALAERRGVITLTPHLGCWEILGQAIGERFLAAHGPLTALFRPARKPWLQALVAGARDRPGLTTLPTTLAGVRGLIRVLRGGGYTGVLPDQVPPQGQGVWAPMFGRPAYTMTLVARLVQQTGARVFFSVGERLPRGQGYVVRFVPFEGTALTDPRATPEAAAAALNEGVAQLVRQWPGQYLWGYARFKQPRIEAAAPAAPKEATS